MKRISAHPHGKTEVLVVFDNNGEARNHLLRDEPKLNAEYQEHAASAESRRGALSERHKVEGRDLDLELAAERASIDKKAFSKAEREVQQLDAQRESAKSGVSVEG